jgi:hypothetical protein
MWLSALCLLVWTAVATAAPVLEPIEVNGKGLSTPYIARLLPDGTGRFDPEVYVGTDTNGSKWYINFARLDGQTYDCGVRAGDDYFLCQIRYVYLRFRTKRDDGFSEWKTYNKGTMIYAVQKKLDQYRSVLPPNEHDSITFPPG